MRTLDVASEDGPLKAGLSVVVPAWNDGPRLRPTLESLVEGLDRAGLPYEIIVVADGCSDGTPSIVRSVGRENVRVLEFPNRLGKGGALIQGWMHARYDRTGFMDADSPIPVADLLRLAGRLDQSDAAIASRWTQGQRPRFHEATARNVLSVGWSVLQRGLRLTSVRDTQCGAKFFRTRELKAVLGQVKVRGWAFDLALLYHWKEAGHTCEEVETAFWRDPPGSRLRVARAVPLMLFSVLGLRLVNSPMGRWISPEPRRLLHRNLALLVCGTRASPRGPIPGLSTGSLAVATRVDTSPGSPTSGISVGPVTQSTGFVVLPASPTPGLSVVSIPQAVDKPPLPQGWGG